MDSLAYDDLEVYENSRKPKKSHICISTRPRAPCDLYNRHSELAIRTPVVVDDFVLVVNGHRVRDTAPQRALRLLNLQVLLYERPNPNQIARAT